jgi:hypothetical protein
MSGIIRRRNTAASSYYDFLTTQPPLQSWQSWIASWPNHDLLRAYEGALQSWTMTASDSVHRLSKEIA